MGRCTRQRDDTSVALKVVPIEGNFPEAQMTFEEILPEIVISKELSDLRHNTEHSTKNFAEVKCVSLVEDRYHPALLHQWDVYAKNDVTDNLRPNTFPDTQLFIVFELEECGCALDSFDFKNLAEVQAVMAQVTLALAVAERALEFEHRDLHWGNVLMKRSPDTNSTAQYHMDGIPMSLNTQGLHVTVIDFTLSRLSKDGCCLFCDQSTWRHSSSEGESDCDSAWSTEGESDCDSAWSSEEGSDDHSDKKSEIQILMEQENGNSWKEYHPYTNVLWLHDLASILMRSTESYLDISSEEYCSMARRFGTFLHEALSYNSAGHLFTECSFFNDI